MQRSACVRARSSPRPACRGTARSRPCTSQTYAALAPPPVRYLHAVVFQLEHRARAIDAVPCCQPALPAALAAPLAGEQSHRRVQFTQGARAQCARARTYLGCKIKVKAQVRVGGCVIIGKQHPGDHMASPAGAGGRAPLPGARGTDLVAFARSLPAPSYGVDHTNGSNRAGAGSSAVPPPACCPEDRARPPWLPASARRRQEVRRAACRGPNPAATAGSRC